jgi:hypothetical protein
MEPEQSLGPDLPRITRKMGCFTRDVQFFTCLMSIDDIYIENI